MCVVRVRVCVCVCVPYMLNMRGGRIKYGILFRFCLFYEYSNLEYQCIYVIYRVLQAEYDIHIPVAASQEYVNTYSTRRVCAHVCLFVVCVDLRSCSRPPTRAWEVARTVVAPPSSVVKCLRWVFVWACGVLFLSCVCVGVGGVVLCRCVCVCVWPVDLSTQGLFQVCA